MFLHPLIYLENITRESALKVGLRVLESKLGKHRAKIIHCK